MTALLAELEALEGGTTLTAALAFYDALEPTAIADVLGRWRGAEIRTGHAFDGLLGPAGWYGKAFHSPDDVNPLLFRRADGSLFAGNPALMPFSLLTRFPRLSRHPLSAALFRRVGPLLATSRPKARLRMTEYRGKLSATMIYDSLPINDVFRLVNADTLMGAMDIRDFADPFLFTLRRDDRRS